MNQSNADTMTIDQLSNIIAGFIATMPIAESIKVQGLKDHYREDATMEGAAGRLAIISVGIELLQQEIENLSTELN